MRLQDLPAAELVYKIGKIECDGHPNRITNISCHVKAIDWNRAVVNMDCFLVVPVRNLAVRFQVFKKDYSNQYKTFLIDSSANLCQVIERRNYSTYGVIVWKLMKQFTTVNHSCPFSGQISTRNGFMNTSLIPPFPQGFYLFSFSFTNNNKYVGTTKFYLEAMEKVKTKKRI
ncbi:uncharacterized protein [Drosophila kikkawai]|uniref:Uncharacterized protein n=1 Tax=Drosophila kikkawai TaxID=30033 RepID=A0A6P4IF98_DROKI|nr:uncharacterized protein LOC108077912 [Drosophila kikkawai]